MEVEHLCEGRLRDFGGEGRARLRSAEKARASVAQGAAVSSVGATRRRSLLWEIRCSFGFPRAGDAENLTCVQSLRLPVLRRGSDPVRKRDRLPRHGVAKNKRPRKKRDSEQRGARRSDAAGAAGAAGAFSTMPPKRPAPLHEIAQTRYLNYALSVITSRALPDVRDGLKPVQRRILYTMWQQRLGADAKHRKCAKVVGDVMGNYHPHGDSSIYDALVRMAQSFMMRVPLVDGLGQLRLARRRSRAAMRYTECRLAPIAAELLTELDQSTVHFRPNYDGTKSEPVVLPAQAAEPAHQRRVGHRRRHGDEHPAAQPGRGVRGRRCACSTRCSTASSSRRASSAARSRARIFRRAVRSSRRREELKQVYETGPGQHQGPRDVGDGRRVEAARKTLFITSIPYSVEQVRPRRAHRRRRAVAQDAAAPRREGRLDRRRAHRARAEEGGRRAEGARVPLQAHAAADDASRST